MTGFARSWGAEAAAPTLLLHCSLAHSGAWDGVARALSGRLRLTAPDLVGHGKGPDRSPARDYHDHATEAAASHLPPDRPCHLIGHSFGATLALRLAIEAPERVASLTLIEPVLFAAAPDSPGAREHEAATAELDPLFAAGDMEGAARLFLSVWGGGVPLEDMPPAQARYMIERIWVVAASRAALHEDSAVLLPRLGSVACPVLLLEGAASPPVIGDIQTAIGGALSQHRRACVAGAGHMLPITHPVDVGTEIAAFLDRLD